MNADDYDLTLPAIDPGDIAAATAAAMRAADAEGLIDVALDVTDTPIGPLTLAATPTGLVKVAFGAHEEDVAETLATDLSPRVVSLPSRLDPVRRQLDEYFEGRRHTFDLAVDWALSRGFRREVLQRLFADVGFGETRSYAEMALAAGSPRAHRAVGSAMATNPVPIVVPCHRVLRTGGSLGGYGGGLDVKRRLLVLEGSLLA
jgi:methylated-DNA-[protein]-cysteine S-methyltransferase